MIKDHVQNHVSDQNKILYDFADIEHYDPDGTYFEFVHDNCNYYDTPGGSVLGNWATEWQGSHEEGKDWYRCSSAHSQALNANRKAYAAWYLWAVLGGWNPSAHEAGVTIAQSSGSTSVTEGGSGDSYSVGLNTMPAATVTITADPDDQLDLGNGAGSVISLTFTEDNWSRPQIIAVTAIDDMQREGLHISTIIHRAESLDSDYSSLLVTPLAVTIRDQSSCLLQIVPIIIKN